MRACLRSRLRRNAPTTTKADGDAITARGMASAIGEAGHALRERDIVLVRTGRDAPYGEPDYALRGPGATAGGYRLALRAGGAGDGHRRLGVGPLNFRAQEALVEREEGGIFREAHRADLPYCQIERLLVGPSALPPTGFRVACFPLRIVGASAAPARVVAVFD